MENEILAQLQKRTVHRERRLRTFQLITIVGVLMAAVYACASLPSGAPAGSGSPGTAGILRVRGIVVEDESGRERILIGAPVPAAANRVRTNRERARQAWAGKMGGDRYMGRYESYRHGMHGILVLDENGYDRVLIGDSVPDPIIGKRIAPSTGVIINDEHGFERSGYGFMDVNGTGRVVLGLDSDDGKEGVVLALSDDGFAGLAVTDGQHSLIVGNAPADHAVTRIKDPLRGLLLRTGRDVKH